MDSTRRPLVSTQETSGMEALMRLVSGPAEVPQLPVHIRPENDLLGLVEHNNVRGAYTDSVFNNLDFIASVVIAASSDKSKDFISGRSVQVSKFEVGTLYCMEMYRTQLPDGTIQYQVERKDGGVEEGGFWFVRRTDGATLFRVAGMEPFDAESDEYLQALHQASKFIDIIAEKSRVRIADLPHSSFDLHTGTAFMERMQKQHSRKQKASRLASKLLNTAKDVGLMLTTKVQEVEGNGLATQERKLAWKKIAGLAMLAPLPGVGTIGDTAIPRPAGVVLVSGVAGWMDDSIHVDERKEEAMQRAIADYDALQINLPDSVSLNMDGEGHLIALVPDGLGEEVSDNAPTVSVPGVSQKETAVVDGMSPRKLEFSGILNAEQCMTINVSPNSQNSNYSLLGQTQKDIDDLEVQASSESLALCNTSPTTIGLSGRTLYFDVQQ